MRGSRLVPLSDLTPCEERMTVYLRFLQYVGDFMDEMVAEDNQEGKREAIFKYFDSLLMLTPLCQDCWHAMKSTHLALVDAMENGGNHPYHVFINFMVEYVSVISNMAVLFADFFFEDWFSMAFYFGDTFWRLFFVRHTHNFDL